MSSITGKTILMIDDSSEILVLARKILENEGAHVIEAETVNSALDLVKETIPHLILTDLVMPEKDGFDFLKFRNELNELKQVPVLILSGLKNRASVEKALHLGASDYVVKPLRANLLVQKVKKALNFSTFRSYKFPITDRPVVEIGISAQVVSINETSLTLEAAIRLGPETTISIQSPLLEALSCGEVTTRTGRIAGNFKQAGVYINDIQFVGMDRIIAKKIREKVGES